MLFNDLSGINILFVEDDCHIMEPMKSAMASIFNKIYTAKDGLAGLELYKELHNSSSIDIIITDICMPNMSGIDMIKEIKKINSEIDFIITTAKDDTEFLLDAIKLNANHYFLKPIKIQDLLYQIDDIIKLKKEKQRLADHERLLSMKELIGNIAHQWRQPLSAISTTASGVKIDDQLGLFNKEETLNKMDFIANKAQYLSEIINTFNNILDDDGKPKKVILQDVIDKALYIERDNLKDNNIELFNCIDYNNLIKPTIVVGKLEQVIIDILNNSQEVMIEKNIKDKWIKIELIKINRAAIITIEDNGGGIPKDILPKIFEPYFTTKHQSQGAGLGLHICYKVITESLKGKLYAQNTENGAKFFIQIPLENERFYNRRQKATEVKNERRKQDRRKVY